MRCRRAAGKALAVVFMFVTICGTADVPIMASVSGKKNDIEFMDVQESDWFYTPIVYVSCRGIMTGMTTSVFGPAESLQRSHFATLLYRMENCPEVVYRREFYDVTEGQFYTDAVLWANESGIVTGYTATGTFEPGRDITREEMVVMLYRYAKKKGLDISYAGDLSEYPDQDAVSSFAAEAMIWAVEQGIIKGDEGLLNPQGKASRAACATMIQRFNQMLKLEECMPEEGQRDFQEQYETEGTLCHLKNLYQKNFQIGVATDQEQIKEEKSSQVIREQFSSITCENAMKPESLLSRYKTLAKGDEEYPVIDTAKADEIVSFAAENGMQVRGHTLVWYSQTPRWFFTEGYSTDPDALFVSAQVMERRMENYICQVITYFNETYPGVISCWDVVNEAIDQDSDEEHSYRTENNYWYEIMGAGYIEKAFTYARKYADSNQKLFYNDYNCYEKTEAVCAMLEMLKEKKLVDGIGVQGHLLFGYPTVENLERTLKTFGEMGLEVQVTELDIHCEDNSESAQKKLALRYKSIMKMIKRLDDDGSVNVTNVTIWGLTDGNSWLNNESHTCYPLLFDDGLTPKQAFFGFALDDGI